MARIARAKLLLVNPLGGVIKAVERQLSLHCFQWSEKPERLLWAAEYAFIK